MTASSYGVADLATDLRSAIMTSSTMMQLLHEVERHLKRLLFNPVFLARDYGLPIPGDYTPRFLYRDPELLFAIHASMMPPGEWTPVHDHGETWAVSGVYHNTLRTLLFERVDDGAVPEKGRVRRLAQIDNRQGEVHVLPPWGIHQNANVTDELTLSIIVHGRDLNQIWRSTYDLENERHKRVKFGPSPLASVRSA